MNFEYFRLTHSAAVAPDEPPAQSGWQPSADVYENRRGWLVKFDLAGVRLADVELSVRGRRLTIRGIRRDWSIEEGRHFHRLEISYDRFQRTIELPCNVDAH